MGMVVVGGLGTPTQPLQDKSCPGRGPWHVLLGEAWLWGLADPVLILPWLMAGCVTWGRRCLFCNYEAGYSIRFCRIVLGNDKHFLI